MAESEVVRMIREYRSAVARNEVNTLRELSRLWVPTYRYLQSRFNDVAAEIQNLMNRGEPVHPQYVFSLQRYQDMMGQAANMISRYNLAAGKVISGDETEAYDLGRSNMRNLVNAAAPDDPMWTRVNRREARITAGMTANGSPLDRLLSKSYGEFAAKAEQVIVTGVATGQGSNWIAQQLTEAALIPQQRALVIARTEVNRAYRQANWETMQSSRAVKGYRRMCYHETACFACLMLDGEFYPVDSEPCDHPNGKCSFVPVTKHFDPGEDENWQRGRDWFMEQDEDTQRRLMGPGRFDLWKTQGVDPRSMVWIKPNQIWGGSPAMRTLESLKAVSYRAGVPVEPTEMTLDMALNREYRAQMMAEKYHISLKAGGKPVTIIVDSTLRGKAGKVAKDDPTTIMLGDSAFISEEELACTIAHEIVHCREYVNTGESDEVRSYKSEERLREFIRGQR